MCHTPRGTFPVCMLLLVQFMMVACFDSEWSALTSGVALQNRSGLLHQKQPGRVRHQASLHWHGLQQTSRKRCLPLMEPYWSVLTISLLNTSRLHLFAASYWHSLSSTRAVRLGCPLLQYRQYCRCRTVAVSVCRDMQSALM